MRANLVLIISIIAAVAIVGTAFFFLRPKQTIEFPIVVQEYADYNCSFCRDFKPTWDQLQAEFTDQEKVRFEFIVHPILGSSSEQAAFAVAAAGRQNRFQEYSDLLFANFGARADTDYIAFAEELELDITQFNQDRESEALQNEVLQIRDENRNNGIAATPTITISGRRVSNTSFDYLRDEINDRIERAEKSLEEQGN